MHPVSKLLWTSLSKVQLSADNRQTRREKYAIRNEVRQYIQLLVIARETDIKYSHSNHSEHFTE